jgi:hypothetical protein
LFDYLLLAARSATQPLDETAIAMAAFKFEVLATLIYLIISFSSVVHAGPTRFHKSRDNAATISLSRNPNYAPNGTQAYLRALAKWGIEAPGKLVNIASNKGDSEYSVQSLQSAVFMLRQDMSLLLVQ